MRRAMRVQNDSMDQSVIVGGRYKILHKIGSGSFGKVYEGVDLRHNTPVAIKLEAAQRARSQLANEAHLYAHLSGGRGDVFTPAVFFCGKDGDYHVMVMELLGESLEELFTYCDERFSLKTTLMLADQMIERMAFIHSRGIVHRDIKPDNFVMGVGRHSHRVFVIDFGLSKCFRDPQTRAHIPCKRGKSLTGTARYCSINTHLGIEQSRRDDMEGMGHLFVYFLKGSLPWQGLKARTKQDRFTLIPRKKMSVPVEELCKGLPVEFASYLNYVRALRFYECPNYDYLRKLFRSLFIREGYQMDAVYDWTVRYLHEDLLQEHNQRQHSTTSPLGFSFRVPTDGHSAGREAAALAVR